MNSAWTREQSYTAENGRQKLTHRLVIFYIPYKSQIDYFQLLDNILMPLFEKSTMTRRFVKFFAIVLIMLSCEAMTGCGQRNGPLRIKNDSKFTGPLCAPGQRVKIGDRVVGQVADGNKWKDFFVDDMGKEHDPDILAEQVWSYLEKTGDAVSIIDDYEKQGHITRIPVISIQPLVVLLVKSPKVEKPIAFKGPHRWHWVSTVSSIQGPSGTPPWIAPPFQGLKWFSPDLKQGPTDLIFSKDGIAEIPISNGNIKFTLDGDQCKITRH